MGIGTENESSLHRSLKYRYAGGGETETLREGYICDAIGPDGEMVEIQTGSFGALKEKLAVLTVLGKVRLVYPVIVKKTIEVYDTGNRLLSRRKSPKKGSAWDLFDNLIYAPDLVGTPRLTIEAALVDATERRVADGKGSWRRKGVSIADRTLDAWRESVVLRKKSDWRRFLPFTQAEEFTAAALAEKAGIPPGTARKCLNVLFKAGIVSRLRKEKRAWVYRIKKAGR